MSPEDLSAQVLEGAGRDLQLLAARGLLPLAPVELIPLQVQLTDSPDEEIAGAARTALGEVEPLLISQLLAEESDAATLVYFARTAEHPLVIEAILRRRDVPRSLLVELAPQLPPDLQEILVLRQDAILEEPTIVDALEANPRLSLYVRRRLTEYREHLLPRERPEPADLGELEQDAELMAALEEVRKLPTEGEIDETTRLSEGQIRALPVPLRLKLARRATRTLRGILIRDSSVEVALAVVRNNPLTDSELELYAASRSVVSEVLDFIARKQDWIKKYAVRLSLVTNPRLQPALATRLASQLSVRDLRIIARDRNCSDFVRSAATRLVRVKAR